MVVAHFHGLTTLSAGFGLLLMLYLLLVLGLSGQLITTLGAIVARAGVDARTTLAGEAGPRSAREECGASRADERTS